MNRGKKKMTNGFALLFGQIPHSVNKNDMHINSMCKQLLQNASTCVQAPAFYKQPMLIIN